MSPTWRQGKRQKPESVVFSWFARTGPYVTHVEAREEAKTQKPRFRKCGFFVVCLYGPLYHPRGGKGRGKNQKKHVLESVVFSWLPKRAPMSPTWKQGKRQKPKNHVLENVVFSWFARTGPYVTHVEAREEAKTKKPRFRKCGFFVVCPYGPLCHPRGGKGRDKNEKNTFLENEVFFVVAHTGPYVTHVGAREEAKTKKTRFRKCGFFVVCPYGPLCHPRGGEGTKKKKHVFRK